MISRLYAKGTGGEDGIRTHEALLGPTPLAGERLRPLGHLSTGMALDKEKRRHNQQAAAFLSDPPPRFERSQPPARISHLLSSAATQQVRSCAARWAIAHGHLQGCWPSHILYAAQIDVVSDQAARRSCAAKCAGRPANRPEGGRDRLNTLADVVLGTRSIRTAGSPSIRSPPAEP
jgi:hypothetical protein